MKKYWLAGLAATLIAAPVMADTAPSPISERGWSDAHWGMNVDEVIAHLSDKSERSDPANADAAVWDQPEGAVDVVALFGQIFEVKYHFTPKNPALSLIKITAEEAEACAALETHFVAHLGDGETDHERYEVAADRALVVSSRAWAKAQNGNRYSYMHVAGDPSPIVYCHILIEDETVRFDK